MSNLYLIEIMKINKLILKLQELFDPQRKKNKKFSKELKVILRQLKKKERSLTALSKVIKDPNLTKLYRTELEIIRIQRKKGLMALKELRQHSKSKNS